MKNHKPIRKMQKKKKKRKNAIQLKIEKEI